MEPVRAAGAAILEAHYYSGGLRYQSVGLEARRPEWVPPPDSVGFRDEFSLARGDVVIEFQRRRYLEQLVTWVGVYTRSVDERLGDRENHAGLGIWLLETSVVGARNLLAALALMVEKFNSDFESADFANQARKFLSEFLPHYVQPARSFLPGFPGAAYSATDLLDTSFFQVAGEVGQESLHLAADQMELLSFSPSCSSVMRALILLSANLRRPAAGGKVQLIERDMDALAQIISHIPAAMSAQAGLIGQLQDERNQIAAKLNDAINTARSLKEDRDRVLAELGAVKKRHEERAPLEPRQADSFYRTNDYSLQRQLSEIDRKLSRLLSEERKVENEDIKDEEKSNTIYISWETVFLISLAIGILIVVGLLLFAGYNHFIVRGSD